MWKLLYRHAKPAANTLLEPQGVIVKFGNKIKFSNKVMS